MTVLIAHNFYQQAGGEDRVFADEREMLTARGHRVVTYTRSNDEIRMRSSVGIGLETLWSQRSYSEVRRLVREGGVDVVHCHNTFPLISPSIYWAACSEGVPVVQTVHNYRLLCAAATLHRDGQICEECVSQRSPLPALRHRCYRDSLGATGVLCTAREIHRSLGSWSEKVTRFIALSEFMRGKLIEGEIPPEKIRVKPNTLAVDPGLGDGTGGYVLFAGRLSREKGIGELCDAWLGNPDLPELIIAGDGPMGSRAREAAARAGKVSWVGQATEEEVGRLMKSARYLITPSTWYEGFPKVVAEAYATGLPVLASRIGTLAEIVREGVTGWQFQPGCVADMVRVVKMAIHQDSLYPEMRRRVRQEYEQLYSAEKNCDRLLEIYDEAVSEKQVEKRRM